MRRPNILYWILALVATSVIGVCLGAVSIAPADIARAVGLFFMGKDGGMQQTLIMSVRLPRVIVAVFVGGSLAVAGAIYQALFRNSLADPYILGISSGAGLGAMLAFVGTAIFKMTGFRWIIVPSFAFALALLTMILVVRLSMRSGRIDATTLLLSGVAISYTLASLTSFLMVVAREQMSAIVYWNMGGLQLSSWAYVAIIVPIAVVGTFAAWYYARSLDLMLLGSERASHMGLDSTRFTRVALVIATILTAGAVSVSGLIGFVGLMVPHIVRLRFGSLHRKLIPASFIAGGTLLVGADVVARTILAPVEVPVGIVTAIVGGPFFVWMLLRGRGGNR